MPSPFGRAPRDQRNKRDRDTTSTTYNNVVSRRSSHSQPQTSLRKNLKESSRDRLRACVAPTNSRESSDPLNDSCEISPPANNADCFWASDDDNRMAVTESSAARRRQSRVLDRWATRQAREMITTIERQAHEAELLALSSSQTVSVVASSYLRETSPAPSEGSGADVPNLRTSSLVQMWKGLEAEARLSIENRRNSGNSPLSYRTNSMEEPSGSSEICEEDGFTDWESDMTTPRSDPHSSLQDPVSDAGESERGRVADIIRRLTTGNRTQSSLISWSDEIDREQHVVSEALSRNQSMSDHRDNAGFIFNENPPRIRGRHAITDLLLQIERERQRELARLGERRAVSRFPQRSRIQSFLRLRILQCEVADQDQQRRASTAAELDQLQRGSTILLLRERFSSRARQDSGTVQIEDSQTSFPLPIPTNSLDSDHSGVSDQPMTEDSQYQEVAARDRANVAPAPLSLPSTSEDLQEEASPSSEVAWQERSLLISNLDWQGTANTETLHDWEGEVVMEEVEPDTQQHMGHTDGTWVGNASLPQGDWEGRRREMYRDWLENNSDNLELRALLERRSVSNSLASDFRERMDQLILSYLQRQGHRPIGESSGEEEEENPVLQENHEVSDADQVAPPSLQLPLPSRLSHHQESLQFSSFVDHSSNRSLEMEFIYDLRGDIARIHHEMCELRKTIESCVDMQMKLQRFIKQEVSAAVCHLVGTGETLNSPKWVRMSKGNCCICYEVQVDSLLYRCGHMCTCFKCAQELQWSSGRCPICRAPIMDVVRAYSNS